MAMSQFLIDFVSIIVLSDFSTSSSSVIFNISVSTVFSEANGKLLFCLMKKLKRCNL